MRLLIFYFSFMFCALNIVHGQTLDYARDLFFYSKPLNQVKDVYYEHSPLLSVIQGYGGCGLKVLLIRKDGVSALLAKKSIEMEIGLEMNRPYLSELKIVTEKVEFNIDEYKPDVIILEEKLLSKYEYLFSAYKNRIMLFNGSIDKPVIAQKNPEIRNWWHYNYRLEGISKELIKVWHAKENLRNQILFLERTKNFNLTLHYRYEVFIFLLVLLTFIFYGYYLRMKRRGYRVLYLFVLIPFLTLVLVLSLSAYLKFRDYYNQVNNIRVQKSIEIKQVLNDMQTKKPLDICVILRALIERIKDNPEEPNIKKDKQYVLEIIMPLNHHPDERVRMLSIDLLGRLNDENYLKAICQQNWSQESSYLVRSRLVRTFGAMQNEDGDKALLAIKEYEKHPYVFYELRDYCLQRQIWLEPKSLTEGVNE